MGDSHRQPGAEEPQDALQARADLVRDRCGKSTMPALRDIRMSILDCGSWRSCAVGDQSSRLKREASALFPTLLRLSVCVSLVENIDGVLRILRAAAPDMDWSAKLKLKAAMKRAAGRGDRNRKLGRVAVEQSAIRDWH